MPIASYPSEDRAAEKRLRELLDAAKITFISVGSRGLTASVAEDKAKQARAILEKAVVAGTLSVTVLDQLPMPKNLRAVRTDDKLRIEEDSASNEEVIVPVAAGLIRSTDYELSVYRGKERVSLTGGTYTPPFDFNRAASKIPQLGESYEVELVVKWFETDAPIRPNWKPQSGGKYKVLVTRTLKLSVGAENTKPDAKVPEPRMECTLTLEKNKAKAGEFSVPATVEIKNVSKENLVIDYMTLPFYHLDLLILDPTGKKISDSPYRKNFSLADQLQITLRPGESYRGTVDIFGNSDKASWQAPGTYKISAIYEYLKERAVSKQVELTLTPK